MSEGASHPEVSSALQRVMSLAERLPGGGGEHHVQLSAQELARACADGQGVPAAIDRFVQSIQQLEGERHAGARRRQQHGAPAIERLRQVLQDDLLPELRRAGLL